MFTAMLSIEKCKGILNSEDQRYTNEEVAKIAELLYCLAEIEVDLFDKIEKQEDLQ